MSNRLIIYVILSNLLLSTVIPFSSTADNASWWNDSWSDRQEIIIPIDTSDELAKYQPIDIHISFNKTCWAKNEDEHSIRVVYQEGDKIIELESQIYDLKFNTDEQLKSCNLVFLIPEQANGEEKYFVYYDDNEKSGPDYEKHVKIEESYYQYEPIQGLGFESSYYKITEEEEIIYAVNKDGKYLGDKVSQQVTRLKQGAKNILPHNSDQVASFAFVYWWLKDGEWQGISAAEQFISKELFVDGNLMVKFGIVSESKNSLLKSTVIYKYYHCPTEDKRIYTNVKHEVNGYPLPKGDEIDVAYIILTCGGIKSSTIEELNFGEIPPNLHFYSEDERIKSHKFDQYPDYSEWQPIIHKTDDYDLGNPPWLSVNYGETGKAHGIIFDNTNILKSGTDERDGISLQLYEAKEIQYPGLDGSFAHLYVMRNAYEKDEPNDEIIPEDYVIEFNAEYFTTENGGYPAVEKESSFYQELISYQPEGDDEVDEVEEEEKYSLEAYPYLPRSLRLKYKLSTLLLRSPQITAEIIHNRESIGYCKTHKIPVTEEAKIDWKNITLFRKAIFTDIPSGEYIVKIWLENSIFSSDKELIGYKIINLNEDSKVRIFCKHEGRIKLSVENQNDIGIENVELYLLDGDSIISYTKSDSDGKAILGAPCGLGSKYSLNTTYKGFFIEQRYLKLGRIRQYIPKRVSINFDTHDFIIRILDSEENTPDFDIDLTLTSEEMESPVIIRPNSTSNNSYRFKALYPANYRLKIDYGQFEIKEQITIPEQSALNINLYDLKVNIKDDWNLTPEAEIDVTLTSKDFEKTVVLNANKLSSEEFLFPDIYPGNYTIKLSYQSYELKESIIIPYGRDGNIQIVFSALFNVTSKVLNIRGEPLKDAKVIFTRVDTKIEGITNENGIVLFSIPPGTYSTKIYSNEELIAQRKVNLFFDKDYSVVTTNEPIIPVIAIYHAIVFLIFGAIYSYKKKNILFFLKILAVVFAITAIVNPWWTIQGSSTEADLETSANIYIMPTEMTTMTTSENLTAGELTILDETYIFVIGLLPMFIITGIAFILVSIILKKILKGKLRLLIMLLVLIAFIGSLVIFSYATSEMSEITVGSYLGNGDLDINIPGEDSYEIMSCSWGPGPGFYLLFGSIVTLLVFLIFKIRILKVK
jgi:hypothetical protein